MSKSHLKNLVGKRVRDLSPRKAQSSDRCTRAVDANSDEKTRKIETRELTLEPLTCGRVLYTEVNTVVFYVDPARHDAVSRYDIEE